MRILAAHDAQGHILEVVLSPSDAPPATVSTETGLAITEVELPKGLHGLDLNDQKQLDKFRQQLQELRVEVVKAKLVPTP